MSEVQICPLCGAPLEVVGKRGLRLRCRKCRSVFDAVQLRQFYLDRNPADARLGVPDFETPHMHATETVKQRQQHVQQLAQQSAQQRAQQSARQPAFSEQGTSTVPVSASRPASPAEEPVSRKGANPAVIILFAVVIVFLIGFGPQLCAAVGESCAPAESNEPAQPATGGTPQGTEGTPQGTEQDWDPVEMVLASQPSLIEGEFEGEQLLAVDYTWINTSDERCSLSDYFVCIATHDGEWIDQHWSAVESSEQGRYWLVNPGQAAQTRIEFELSDDIVDGEIVVDLWSTVSDTGYETKIDVAGLRVSQQAG